MRTVIDPPIPVLIGVLLVGLFLLARKLERRQFLALVLSTVLAFSLAEGFSRVADIGRIDRRAWIEPVMQGERYPYEPNGRLVYRYSSNPRGYFDDKNEVIGTINSHGFRGPERTVDKPEGVYRVAFLGDSFALGVGVKDEDTLPASFERALDRLPGRVEALNFGVSGTSTERQIEFLEDDVLSFDPDAVVIVMFLNDATRLGTVDFLSRPRILVRVRQHSRFIHAVFTSVERALLHRVMVRHFHRAFEDHSPDWRRVRDALGVGKRMSESYGFQLMVVLYPVLIDLDESRYPFLEIHGSIEAACNSLGIPFVDLLETFLGQVDHDMWVHPADQHPNEVAHAMAAATLADVFVSRGWIDDPGSRPAE